MEPSEKRPPHPQAAVSREACTDTGENRSPDHSTQSLALEDCKPSYEQTIYSSSQLNRRIKAADVRKLCGNISDMTLFRWLHSENLNFPAPTYLGRLRYWRESDVIAWLDAQPHEAASEH